MLHFERVQTRQLQDHNPNILAHVIYQIFPNFSKPVQNYSTPFETFQNLSKCFKIWNERRNPLIP